MASGSAQIKLSVPIPFSSNSALFSDFSALHSISFKKIIHFYSHTILWRLLKSRLEIAFAETLLHSFHSSTCCSFSCFIWNHLYRDPIANYRFYIWAVPFRTSEKAIFSIGFKWTEFHQVGATNGSQIHIRTGACKYTGEGVHKRLANPYMSHELSTYIPVLICRNQQFTSTARYWLSTIHGSVHNEDGVIDNPAVDPRKSSCSVLERGMSQVAIVHGWILSSNSWRDMISNRCTVFVCE